MIGVPLLLVLAAATVGILLKLQHDDHVAAQKRARAHQQQVAAQQAQQAQQAAAQAQQAQQAISDSARQTLVNSLQDAVKKDAEKDVANGTLNGPITKVQCQPASAADQTAPIASYTCLAATSTAADGTLSGYRFTATIDTGAGSYTWHLGG